MMFKCLFELVDDLCKEIECKEERVIDVFIVKRVLMIFDKLIDID